MEHVAVRRVGIISAIHFSRHHDAHGRLLFFHRANLHRRSVRAQQMAALCAFDIKSVHVVARGMMLGNVEGFEIVIGRFDLRAFDNAETNRGENSLKFFEGLADQMPRAESALDAGKREIDFVALGSGLFRRSFHRPLAFCDNGFDVRLELVQLLSYGGL